MKTTKENKQFALLIDFAMTWKNERSGCVLVLAFVKIKIVLEIFFAVDPHVLLILTEHHLCDHKILIFFPCCR